jgi:DNA-directed RNA polymerase subunit alpha
MNYTINLPSKPKIVQENDNKGVFEIDELYTGYGHTLGNSLRRIILSSLPGAAITKVKIEGVQHEFSTINNIKEDVIVILLNLKKIRFKMHSDEPQLITLSVAGIKMATAKDIKTSSLLEVLNKDAHIATLTTKDAKLNIEMTVEKGMGYISRDSLQKELVEVGTIYLDALFTPIRRINYEVENMRVGEKTDYNRLRFFIETDGSITPREALEKSIEIMIKQLKAIVGFKEEEEKPAFVQAGGTVADKEKEKKKKEKKEGTEVLKTKIEDMKLSPRIIELLSQSGIKTIGGLIRKKESDLLEIGGVGKVAVQKIKRILGNYGLILNE